MVWVVVVVVQEARLARWGTGEAQDRQVVPSTLYERVAGAGCIDVRAKTCVCMYVCMYVCV